MQRSWPPWLPSDFYLVDLQRYWRIHDLIALERDWLQQENKHSRGFATRMVGSPAVLPPVAVLIIAVLWPVCLLVYIFGCFPRVERLS